jgi:thiol peroxidase
MMKHIVAWKLKNEAQGNNKETNACLIKEKLEGLVGKIPGLLKAKVVKTASNCKDFDLALISKLESAEALAAYQANPLHEEAASFVRSVVEARACIDYEHEKPLRKGVITMKGNPMTLAGTELKVGDKAPDFTVLSDSMAPVSLKDFEGKFKVISVTPSLDTPVCNLQIHWFNEDAANHNDTVVLNISMDLPFAIKRFCATAGIDKAKALSDHNSVSFGKAYGVLIKELRLLARSIFIVDKSNVIRYIQIVSEQTNEPNYEAAIEVLKKMK